MNRGIRKKRVEKEVLSKDQRSILSRMPQLAMVVDKKGQLMYINKAFGKFTKEAILGRSVYKFLDKDSVSIVQESIKKGMKKKKGEYIAKSIPVLGKTMYFESHYSPFFNGRTIVGVLIVSTDVTEREETKRQLEEQNHKYSGVLETLREGVFIVDRKAKFTYVNPAVAKIYEFDEPNQMLGKSIFDFILPSGYKRLMKTYRAALSSKKVPDVYKTEMVTRKGHKKIVEARVTLIKEEGKVVGARGLVRDITAQVKSQKTLNLFMQGFETSPNSQVLVAYENKKPVIKWTNKAFTKTYGYSSTEVAGENPSILSSEHTPKGYFKDVWKSILNPEVGTWSGEVVNKKKDGSFLPVILTISTIFDQKRNPVYFTASHIDISERKQIEERLRLTQFSMDHSSIPMYILREDGSFYYVNNAATLDTGYSYKEFLNKMTVYDLSVGMTKDRWKKFWNQMTDTRLLTLETEHHKKDGTTIPVEVSANRIEYGGESYNLVYARDITERKLREEQAKEVDKMKTEFVSLASHQLRTPLTAIRWGVEMLGDQLAQTLTPQQRSMFEDVNASTRRMTQLVSGLLNVSRIETGRLKVEPKKVPIEELIADIVYTYQPIASAKNIKINIRKSKKLKPLAIDESLVREVISNLLGNAVKYSHPGEKPVEISLKQDGNKDYLITVKDHGIGIQKEDQKRVFEKFFRSPEAVAKETDGNGLGLYIAKLIMDQVGGEIAFTSTFGKGSAFTLRLPGKGMKAKEGEKGLAPGKV